MVKGKKPKKQLAGSIVGADQPRRLSRVPKIVWFVITGVLIILLIMGAIYFVTKNRKKPTPQPAKPLTPYETFLQSDNYKKLDESKKLNIRLSDVASIAATNNYQGVLDELAKVQQEYPSAESNTDFLLYGFIANYELGNKGQATVYAKKIKALPKGLPKQYSAWKGLVNQYAAQ